MKKLLCTALALLLLVGCSAIRPTAEHHPSGFDGELLYVNLEGETYCYRRVKAGTGGLTPEDDLDSFTVQTAVEGIVWTIWSVKEHPDRTTVAVISGTNSSWTYEYCKE